MTIPSPDRFPSAVREMSRTAGDRAEIIALSFWDSREAIEGFAGPDIEQSVLYPQDEHYLSFLSSATH